MTARLESSNQACLFLTGSCNTAPFDWDIERKGDAKLCHVPMVGCHKQSVLNCTGRDPFIAGRATEEFTVRQRSMRGKPLYLVAQPCSTEWRKGTWRDAAGLNVSRCRVRANALDDGRSL